MIILGIDYGRRKIGLSLAYGNVASPIKTFRFRQPYDAIENIKKIVQEENVEKIVVGLSEGEMEKEQAEFIEKLKADFDLPIEGWDETLSTQDAINLAQEAGLSQKKRKDLEDAFASAIMLQSYLDSKNGSKT